MKKFQVYIFKIGNEEPFANAYVDAEDDKKAHMRGLKMMDAIGKGDLFDSLVVEIYSKEPVQQ